MKELATMTTGLQQIPFADYLKSPAIGSHTMQGADRSFESYATRRDAPDKDSKDFILGRAFHSLTLTPGLFAREFVAMPPEVKTRGAKAYKEAVARESRDVLMAPELATVRAMAASVKACPVASRLTSGADYTESSFFWEIDGLKCKGRADSILVTEPGRFTLVDLKSCRNSGHRRAGGAPPFANSVIDFGYLTQGAWYIAGIEAVTGWTCDGFILVAVEKEAPFEVECYAVPEEVMDLGRDQMSDNVKTILAGPQKAPAIKTLALPSWATRTN